jgi:hypothetical protein
LAKKIESTDFKLYAQFNGKNDWCAEKRLYLRNLYNRFDKSNIADKKSMNILEKKYDWFSSKKPNINYFAQDPITFFYRNF